MKCLDVDGRITFKNGSQKKRLEYCGLTQDRNQWRDLVNTVMNIRFP